MAVEEPQEAAPANSKGSAEPDIIDALSAYVKKSCPGVLGGDAKTLEAALSTQETQEILKLFANDTQISCLIVQRKLKRKLAPGEDPMLVKNNEFYVFELQMKPLGDSNGGAAMAYLKVSSPLDGTSPLHAQLHVVQIDEKNPFAAILAYVRHCFLPFTRSLMATALEDDKTNEADLGSIRGVNTKLSELEVELLRSQEQVEIPHIILDVVKSVDDFVKGGGKAIGDLPKGSDATFLNDVQKRLNEWKKQILAVTRLNRDVDSGTTMHEINFWMSMEKAIQHIYAQRDSEGVELSFQLLKDNKRFLATTGFMPDVGLSDDKEKDNVYKYSALLRDFPIKPLLSAADVTAIMTALDTIFNHLKQIRRIEYPLARAIRLVHAISRDMVATLTSTLNSRRPMALNFEEFDRMTQESEDLFNLWSSQWEGFSDELRDIKKQRPDEDILKIPLPFVEVQAVRTRIAEVRKIRKEHEELRSVVSTTLTTDPMVQNNALKAIQEAYQHLRDVDVLAVTMDGSDIFDNAVKSYKARIDRVECDLEDRIRQMLTAAKDDANEMFRVCAKFNALFVRPRIQSAIREYQEQLTATVKKDIEGLQEKFKSTYSRSQDAAVSTVRDLPPVSGAILWARQLERQLDTYISRIEDVLGKQWVHHTEGRTLSRECDQFRIRLQPDRIFQQWLSDNKEIAQSFQVESRIFKVEVNGSQTRLLVNFDRKMVTLFKEVRNLGRLGLKVPYEIKIAADEAREKYPFAMRLDEVIRAYMRTSQTLEKMPSLAPLAASYRKAVQDGIASGINCQWDTEKLKDYVDNLGTQAVDYEDQVDELFRSASKTTASLALLETCELTDEELRSTLNQVQSVINFLDKRGYSNLHHWVKDWDTQAEDILVKRLQQVLKLWVEAQDIELGSADDDTFDLNAAVEEQRKRNEDINKNDQDFDDAQRKAAKDRSAALGFILKNGSKHRITIRNQVLHVDPPLENAMLVLSKDLQRWLSAICDLPRLRCFWSAEQVAKVDSMASRESETFRSALGKLGTSHLQQCFDKINGKIGEGEAYVATWMQYQALWDMDLDQVCATLGDNLAKYERLLLDMKRSRSTFDTSGTTKRFGPVVIEYASVQSKVNNKYDQWMKNIMSRYSTLLGVRIAVLYNELGVGRKQLETFSFEFTTTKEIVASVTLLGSLNSKAKLFQEQLSEYDNGEGVLTKSRFLFPEDWLYMERVRSEWSAFEAILNRKLQRMNKDADKIQSKISEESKRLEMQVAQLVANWKKNRPIGADLDHNEVMNSLADFDIRVTALQGELDGMVMAREALRIPPREEHRLKPVREELNALKSVWDVLGASWNTLSEIGDKPFKDVKSKDIRRDLAKLQSDVLRLPADVRQYQGFENLKNMLKDRLEANHMLTELGSGVLRPKHQKQILNILKMDLSWGDVTVNDLWNADVKRHMKQIRFILEQAQGESALEEFLSEVASNWEATKLELVDFRQKTFLIKNWDPIFEQLGNALSDLSSMKHSPFYAAFETEAEKWATKLNRAQAIFDIQIDVQRRWVYLEGIFTGSADVQVQLAYQYKQFQNFDRDFCRLMREMKREDQADYWVRPERGLLATVEGWAETLAAIQKALSEYLEKQRQGFPRFYFVGDEDLLEIIGNGKNVSKVQRHLSKMFAGISAVTLLEDGSTITHMESPEGEVVRLNTPIKVHEEKSIQSWLLRLESMMRESLATLLVNCLEGMSTWRTGGDKVEPKAFFAWVDQFPAQIVNIATMIDYSETVEEELSKGKGPTEILARVLKTLEVLADQILDPMLNPATRKKYEQLITEMVHQRDVSRHLIKEKVVTDEDYTWLGQARFYFRRKPKQQSSIVTGQSTVASALIIQISRASFYYGFEYLGVSEKLVQTPLTDRAYLTLCEAMHMRLGGNPYGPAGTGKTESVKALGAILGRFVLVFNCDETFDFQAMGRILVGLCQCGAWGCFDEFNRLEERILSAVSQQILTIQTGLQGNKKEIALLGKNVSLSGNMGMFVTMNPGYAGRSNLPDNLKQLFRGIAMIKPDASLIGQVMLFSQGFRTSENVAGKVVMLFDLCQDQLSSQSHYDFGLRALKSVLRSSGNLKRKVVQMRKARAEERSPEDGQVVLDADSTVDDYQDLIEDLDFSSVAGEQAILVKSICGTIVPKLVSADIPLFTTLLQAVFPKCELSAPTDKRLLEEIKKIASKKNLVNGQNWIDKMMQLYEIQNISHGVIMVGPAGTGKSTAWTTLREAMETTSTKRIKSYVIDPKALSKDELYGFLDNTTLEWTDGVFTSILRKIIDNVRGEQQQTHWIIFDGDVDPEWAENLNSTLDDNKLFTLPNGERLALTPNIRLMFEVDSLKHATLATVSRCGMVWFSEKVIGLEMHLENYWRRLGTEVLQQLSASVYGRWKSTQETAAESIKKFFVASEAGDETHLIARCLEYVSGADHVMQYTLSRSLASMFCMLKHGISKLIEYNDNHVDFPLDDGKIKAFMEKTLVYAMLWGFAGDLNLENRVAFGHEIGKHAHAVELPLGDLIEYEPRVEGACWVNWSDRVPAVEMDAHKITKPDVVIQTVDTVRHTDVLSGWLGDHRPLILCGPPGAGKSMTLTSVLTAMPDFELVTLNFSSSTGIDLILRTLKHNCTAEKTPGGVVMRPTVPNKWLVIFCDEINLPQDDAYQTQHVITFLRQISEHGGFWRASDLSFVTLEKVQIIGACNPPEDAGRVKLTNRFLRHCPLMFVDFPSVSSLRQIYGTFNRALMKLQPPLRGQAEPLTEAMIEVYSTSQARFTPDLQPHYIYSPRELSRWVRAMFEAMAPAGGEQQSLSLDELVRLWLHEALRLFSDRLTTQEECTWTDEKINEIAHKHFRGADLNKCLVRPVLYSDWLSKRYESVEQEELREHIKLRLQVFREEELDVKLVIFDEVLAHILRIDRVLRQPMGHLLLVGASGGGKTVLSKFVSWMCGYSVFQIKVHKFYKAIDFDADLRAVLIRSGCQSEKVCFIFDESNVLDSAFLERMNALLASGEVPGLFEGADWDGLMEQCKLAASRDGLIINKEEALYKFFCKNVQRNLHVVFTMNPSNEDFDNRSATSPALFNRCVIDWFGEWSETALYQVGHEFTMKMQLSDAPPNSAAVATPAIGYTSDDEPDQKPQLVQGSGTERDCVVSSLVYVHNSVAKAMQLLARNTNRRTYITPRHFLDFISHYVKMSSKKRHELEEQQMHLTSGLRKLKETQSEVAGLRKGLEKFEVELKVKETAANSKLEQMMVDKAEAERKRDASEEIASEISAQETQISERKIKVEAELAGAKPALEQAAAAVRDINKADLDQVSRFPNPPGPVKLALEPVVLMLGHSIDDWQGIRKVLRDSTNPFIKTILNYDINKLTEKLRVKIEKTYMTDPSFTFDVVYKASKACGPLVTWVSSVVNYSRIKNTVQPLIDEMEGLEAKADALKSKMTELTKIREELGKRIDAFKTEYSGLVGEAQAVKHDMDSVVVKCSRSESLLSGLATEQDRWAVDCEGFKEQIRTVTGDALLSAAFVAYIGYFNQSYRAQLVEKWTARLEDVKVPVRTDLSLINFLSHPGQRLEWKANELPDDDLCVENAIMMQTFNRYPLVIDPSGQAVTFLMKQYKDRKIIRTSFLDSSFLKHLEAALRFGNALLVEDVESLDPILNSVLNKEIFRQGGRVMITLGDKELDFSPSFVIFLATRDPNCHFTPDLCSRVTFINFTVTHSSLTTQCLSKVLKAERPEVDRNRSDMLKLQGEFRVRLRNLEDTLLQSLAAVKGNILDDDKVMNTLETLKTQSVEVMLKMAESDKTMEEIEEVSNEYRPFARSCSAVYFSLENLGQVHFLYQYSLMFFLDIADKILFKQSNEVKAETNPKKRLQMINKELFYLVYNRVARGLLHQDQIGFALRLAQCAREVELGSGTNAVSYDEMEFFLKGRSPEKKAIPSGMGLTTKFEMNLGYLLGLPSMAGLSSHLTSNAAAWKEFAVENKDVGDVTVDDKGEITVPDLTPTGWEKSTDKAQKMFHQMLVCKCLRPDRVTQAAQAFVKCVFGNDFLGQDDHFDFKAVVIEESNCYNPLLLVSRPGYDASSKVDALVQTMGKHDKYESMAMGSPEGYDLADRAVNSASRNGTWVLLKNVHLSINWLGNLEKRLHRMTHHADFRLFLTMELNEKVPSNLFRMSSVIIFEPPVGMKSSMTRMLAAMSPERVNKAPTERGRLYFLLAWVHSVILERLRYVPVGWTKGFEFGETDARCAMDAVDEWVDKKAQGKANLSPGAIPWDALQALLEQIIYGGRIDNEFDQARLHAFVTSLFTRKAYDGNFAMCSTWDASAGEYKPLMTMPDGKDFAAFKKWVDALPDVSSPELLGLPSNAESMLLSVAGEHMSVGVLKLQDISGGEEEGAGDMKGAKDAGGTGKRLSFSTSAAVMKRPIWMVSMEQSASRWLAQLPSVSSLPPLPEGKAAESLVLHPLYRCMQREYNTFRDILLTVHEDLTLVKAVLSGKEPANNRVRALFISLKKDSLPVGWGKPEGALSQLPTTLWMTDFVKRCEQMGKISNTPAEKLCDMDIWLGGMKAPEAFVAATRQAVAQAHSWSLEDVQLRITVGDTSANRTDSYTFLNLDLQGAVWEGSTLSISNTELTFKMPPVRFTWVKNDATKPEINVIRTPFYLDQTRSKYLFAGNLSRPASIAENVWSQRGLAITCWSS